MTRHVWLAERRYDNRVTDNWVCATREHAKVRLRNEAYLEEPAEWEDTPNTTQLTNAIRDTSYVARRRTVFGGEDEVEG